MMQYDDSSSTTPKDTGPDEQGSKELRLHSEAAELRFEEELGKLSAQLENLTNANQLLEKDNQELSDRIARLRQNNESLQQELQDVQDAAKLNGSAEHGHADPSRTQQLELDLQKQEDLINDYETTIAKLQGLSDSQAKQVSDLQTAADRSKRLQDELDEVKFKNSALLKERNTLEKYKQKVQNGQEIERENRRLQQLVDEYTQNQNAGEGAKQQLAGMKKTVDSYKKTMATVERDHAELVKVKHRLEMELAAMRENYDILRQQQQQDAELAQTLEEKVRELESGTSPEHSSVTNLEAEMQYTDKTKTDMLVTSLAFRPYYWMLC